MTDPNWRYSTEVTNGTSNVSAGRCPKHNLPLDDIPTPPPTLTKGNFILGQAKICKKSKTTEK